MYTSDVPHLYGTVMADVGVAQLRRELKAWLDRVRAGEEVLVTDRGRPVARLVGVDSAPLLDQLQVEGTISAPPTTPRPVARGADRVRGRGSVSDLVTEDRERRR